MNDQFSQALAVAMLAFIAGLAVGQAAQKHQHDKADLQRQIWDLKKATLPFRHPKGAVTDEPA